MTLSELRHFPDRLLRDLANAPLIPESEIDAYVAANGPGSPTPAELDVLRCLSHGMTEKMAAEALGRSPETVKSHLRAARYKLRAKNSCHAVALAIRQRLII